MDDEKIVFGIYVGLRDDSFKDLISNILRISPEYNSYKTKLLEDSSLSYFSTAFTHPNADSNNNYNFLKALGHVSFQKNIVWYLSRKKVVVNDKTKLDQTITDYKIRLIKSLGKITVNNIHHCQGKNRNIAASVIDTDILTFFDVDDIMHPQRLEIIMNSFEKGIDGFIHNNKILKYCLYCKLSLI